MQFRDELRVWRQISMFKHVRGEYFMTIVMFLLFPGTVSTKCPLTANTDNVPAKH